MRALCLRCGAGKYGALTSCRVCGHHPADGLDEARHLHVCEDLDDTRREEISRAIQEERAWQVDEAVVQALVAELEEIGDMPVFVYGLVGVALWCVFMVGLLVLFGVVRAAALFAGG